MSRKMDTVLYCTSIDINTHLLLYPSKSKFDHILLPDSYAGTWHLRVAATGATTLSARAPSSPGVSIDTLWVVFLCKERHFWFQVEAIQLHSGIKLVALLYGRRFVSCRSREMIRWSMRSCGHYDIALLRITATISEVHTYIDPRLDGVRQGHSTYELSVGPPLIDRPRR
jgi:hypothetical protein